MSIAVASALLAAPTYSRADPVADPQPNSSDRFYHQTLEWKPCGVENLDKAGGECANVQVPLDYARPGDRTINLAISRVKASDPARRRGILLSNPGGPGGPGLDSVDLLGDVLSPDVLASYDLIGMDPRGVGESSRSPRCGWPVGEMIRSAGLDPLGFVHDTVQSAGMAATCVVRDPELVRQFTTRNTARDMDVVRAALGEQKVNFYGLSYGTYLGAVFTQMFPERSDRIVLDSAIDPDRYWEGLVQDWGPSDEIALDDWAVWAAARDEEFRLGATPQQVRAKIEELVRVVNRRPIVIDDFAIDDHWLPFILHSLLWNFRLNEPLAQTVRELADDAGGPPTGVDADHSNVAGTWGAIKADDQAWPTDEQWETLRAADRLEELAPGATVQADADGSVSVEVTLRMPSMAFLRLEPVA
jgi:pimeloyl-ACP methyl ester carboxylesterase